MLISETRQQLVGGMYRYISNIVTIALENKKKIIIWGCGKGGAFLRHLICDVDGRLDVAYYIDEHMILPCGSESSNICRSSLLRYLPKEEYVVLLSIRRDALVEKLLEKLGYEKNRDYYDVRSDIGGSYLEYLQLSNDLVDFSYVTKEDRPDIYSGEYYESKPFDHSSIDSVFETIRELPCEKAFFDIGCGKGQILLMAAMSDMSKIGGIDFNGDVAETAKRNMKALQIDSDVVIGDATEFNELDDYSIFFLYNPFGEKSIQKVISNIKDSLGRRNRDVFLVYGNPFYHDAIMESGDISLYSQIRVDLYDPILNIYRIGGQYE